jgi:hypothetical protein
VLVGKRAAETAMQKNEEWEWGERNNEQDRKDNERQPSDTANTGQQICLIQSQLLASPLAAQDFIDFGFFFFISPQFSLLSLVLSFAKTVFDAFKLGWAETTYRKNAWLT